MTCIRVNLTIEPPANLLLLVGTEFTVTVLIPVGVYHHLGTTATAGALLHFGRATPTTLAVTANPIDRRAHASRGTVAHLPGTTFAAGAVITVVRNAHTAPLTCLCQQRRTIPTLALPVLYYRILMGCGADCLMRLITIIAETLADVGPPLSRTTEPCTLSLVLFSATALHRRAGRRRT